MLNCHDRKETEDVTNIIAKVGRAKVSNLQWAKNGKQKSS